MEEEKITRNVSMLRAKFIFGWQPAANQSKEIVKQKKNKTHDQSGREHFPGNQIDRYWLVFVFVCVLLVYLACGAPERRSEAAGLLIDFIWRP